MNYYANLCRKLHSAAYLVLRHVLTHEELTNLDEIVGLPTWDSDGKNLKEEPNAAKTLIKGFLWGDSKQGHMYWVDVHDRLVAHYENAAISVKPTCNCYATPESSLYEVISAKCMYKSLDGGIYNDLTAAAKASREYLLDKAESKFIRAFTKPEGFFDKIGTFSVFTRENREHIEAYYKEIDSIEAME